MKKNSRVFWIVCASLVGLGLICLAIGFATGAGTVDFRNKLADGLVISDLDFKDRYSEHGDSLFAGESKQFENVKKLEIDVSEGKVEILSHDESYVEVETKNNKEYLKISVTQNGDTLQIESRFKHKISIGFMGIGSTEKITIYVPRGMEFDKVDIEAGASELYVEDIQAREFQLNAGAGRVELDTINVKELDLECGVGEVRATEMQVEEGKINGGVGQIHIELIGNQKDYNYKIALGVGSLRIGDDKYSGLGTEKKVDNGANKELKFECGIGNIEVLFAE